MASSSSTPSNALLAQPTEKLAKTNHALWFSQVHATIRGAKLLGYLTGDSRAPRARGRPLPVSRLGAPRRQDAAVAAQSGVCVKPPPNSPPMASALGLHVEAATLGLRIETAAEELHAKPPTCSLEAGARPLIVAADYACQLVAVARPACARNQLLPFVNGIPCWRL
jgi:hypothetical protein